MLELLLTLAVTGVIASIAPLALRPLVNEARNAAGQVEATVKMARVRAMATTSAYRIVVDGTTSLRIETAATCSAPADDWSEEVSMSLDLPDRTYLSGLDDGEELLCYDARGFGDASATVTVRDGRDRSATVDIFAGGSVELR